MELATIEQDIDLFTGNPDERMGQMKRLAKTIAQPVEEAHTVTISGRKHVRVEGWTMLGAMLGVSPYLVWSRRTSDPEGWEARVEARRGSEVVGSAEAMCTRGEATWKSRDDYALRSMAQTRATSKALRQPLGFVITLAGFDATPAEEMSSDFHAPPPRPEGEVQDYLTEGQRKKIYALRSKLVKAGAFTEELFDSTLEMQYSATITGLTKAQASELIERLEKTEAKLAE